jgi:acetyltransferase-like isoleucine patch superfamily enzyme
MAAADDSVTKHLVNMIDYMDKGQGTWIADNVVFTKRERIVIGAHCRIDDFVKLEGGAGLSIGDYIHIASFCHLNIGGGKLLLGSRSAFASGCKIITGGNRPEGQSMSAVAPMDLQVIKLDTVVICEDACILTNAVVLPGVRVGVGARLAAGSVLTKSIPDYEIWAGVPAKKIGQTQ